MFFFQAEDGIRDLVRSRGLGDVYKRQGAVHADLAVVVDGHEAERRIDVGVDHFQVEIIPLGDGRPVVDAGAAHRIGACLLYTSDAADERSSVDLGGRRILKKKNNKGTSCKKHQ